MNGLAPLVLTFYPLAPFRLSPAAPRRSPFHSLLTGLTGGEIVSLDITLTSGYDGLSQVPLPPAVWLFGSGLAGLLLVARRKYIRS